MRIERCEQWRVLTRANYWQASFLGNNLNLLSGISIELEVGYEAMLLNRDYAECWGARYVVSSITTSISHSEAVRRMWANPLTAVSGAKSKSTASGHNPIFLD